MIVVAIVPVAMIIVAIAVAVVPVAVIVIVVINVLDAFNVFHALDMPNVLTAVARHVLRVIPIVLHEIDRPAAGMVLSAMPAPVSFMSRWHVQVNGLQDNVLGRLHRHDRLCINDRWRRNIADVDLSVEAGLANTDGYPDVSCKGWSRKEAQCCRTH